MAFDSRYQLGVQNEESQDPRNHPYTANRVNSDSKELLEQAHRRQKEFEERERIADLIESKAVPETHSDANKVYNMWLEKQRDRPGVRNDPK